MKFKIIEKRKKKKLTQVELAYLAKVSLATIIKLERAERSKEPLKDPPNPSIITLEKIAKVLGCKVRDLLNEEE